ncbi:MAG: ATP-binding protein [Candidatus Sedimenticola sp. 20ELBAFRAG]
MTAFIKKMLIGINQLILLLAVMVGILISVTLLYLTELQQFEELDRLGNERLELYASTVQSAHKRFDYLPFIVSDNNLVKALLQGQELGDQVNRKLEEWQTESNAAVLYLMDRQGVVRASSNWRMPDSFIGNDYHFRPYFQDAIKGGQGRFFAVGVTTGRPGLFLSGPVMAEGEVLGVAVVKIDMTQLEMDWASGGENVWVADRDGVIFLASNPEWKYKSLRPLDELTFDRLKSEKKYSTNIISPLAVFDRSATPQGKEIIKLSGTQASHGFTGGSQSYMLHNRSIKGLDWTLYYLTSLQDLSESKRNVVLISTLVAMLVALLGFFFASRVQSRQLLEKRVEVRTRELNETNLRLRDEIRERIKTEEQLRQTHEELIQAEKLAALGQMSAGLVHEINQPLSAMQTFLASTRLLLNRDDKSSVEENLDDIEAMVRRMNSIVSHLKSFASKSKGQTTRVALDEVVENALLLMRPRLKRDSVTLEWQPPSDAVCVYGDEIKLEQIMINLIRNALDAMQYQEQERKLGISVLTEDKKVTVQITDTGPGIMDADLPRVFDPFFTTKEPGQGLGLGLSVSFGIAKEFGGNIEAENRTEGGAVFRLSLDAAEAA